MANGQPSPEDQAKLAALYSSGDFAGLEKESRRLVESFPGIGFLWQVLGVALNSQGKDALDVLQKAVSLSPDDAQALSNLGNAQKTAGLWEEAESSYRCALALNPADVVARYNLGSILQERQKFSEAEAAYRQAIDLAPDFVPSLFNLGTLLDSKGDTAGAESCYRHVLQLDSGHLSANYNLGSVLLQLGGYAEAETCFRQVLMREPARADALCRLGKAQKELGQLKEAESSYLGALALQPNDIACLNGLALLLADSQRLDEAERYLRQAVNLDDSIIYSLGNLGYVLNAQGRFREAEAILRRALELGPDLCELHTLLGAALVATNRAEQASEYYRKALQLQPNSAQCVYNLGFSLQEQGLFDDASNCYRRAIALNSEMAVALNNLGLILGLLEQFAEAEAMCQRALAIEPENSRFHVNLGSIRLDLGQYELAEASFRRALELDPKYCYALSNILFLHTLDGRHSDQQCMDDARNFGRLVSAQATGQFSRWRCDAEPERLRVGLVSGDIRDHSVGHFLEDFLKEIDPARLELIAYQTHRELSELTERVSPCFAEWHSLVSLTDEVAAKRIHEDGVHVLIDLAGHMAYNRLPAFAWKPAPVQASWLGYCATTGVAEMDYYIADAETLPVEQEKNFVEKIWRLPDSYLCFSKPAYEVAVSPPPVLAKGYLTFGSFNNLAKMTDEVVGVWSRILQAVPDSRLLLKAKQLKEPNIRGSVLARFARHGIDAERLILENPIGNRGGHLAAYGLIDIGLDTFPYNGVTTTMEALWMGVPVLTLAGERFLARQGVGILTHAGLGDWIAANPDELVVKAVAFSQDQASLRELRAGLRAQILASPLLDARRFARNFEDALWGMWKKYKEA